MQSRAPWIGAPGRREVPTHQPRVCRQRGSSSLIAEHKSTCSDDRRKSAQSCSGRFGQALRKPSGNRRVPAVWGGNRANVLGRGASKPPGEVLEGPSVNRLWAHLTSEASVCYIDGDCGLRSAEEFECLPEEVGTVDDRSGEGSRLEIEGHDLISSDTVEVAVWAEPQASGVAEEDRPVRV